MHKLGKKPARQGAVQFKLIDYIDKTKLTPPNSFGHEQAIKTWGMLGNDKYGDCVWAGAAHETMDWNREANKTVTFTDASVLDAYTEVTGFNPNDPSTDQGTDVQVAASFRRKTGVLDANGKRHKVAAYLSITPGDLAEHKLALWLFGAVGIGINFPKSAMDQFNAGKPWSVVSGSPIDGGHYIPLVAYRGELECVTWGAIQKLTSGFLKKYNDESVVYLSEEMLTSGKSSEGFNLAALKSDLAALTAA